MAGGEQLHLQNGVPLVSLEVAMSVFDQLTSPGADQGNTAANLMRNVRDDFARYNPHASLFGQELLLQMPAMDRQQAAAGFVFSLLYLFEQQAKAAGRELQLHDGVPVVSSDVAEAVYAEYAMGTTHAGQTWPELLRVQRDQLLQDNPGAALVVDRLLGHIHPGWSNAETATMLACSTLYLFRRQAEIDNPYANLRPDYN